MNEIIADFAVLEDFPASEKILELNLVDIFLAEHGRLMRIVAILKRRAENQTGPSDKKVIVSEELEIVRESLQNLDESLLGPVVLRYFCDLDSKEIGEILQQNPSTVRGRLRDARLILAKRLLERGIEPS